MAFRQLLITEEHLRLLDSYSGSLRHAQFTQSSRWAQFQKEGGQRIVILGDDNKEKLYLLIRHKLPFNRSYWYLPRSPFFENTQESNIFFNDLRDAIKEIDPKALFIRLEPVSRFESNKLRPTINIQPNRTLLLSLVGSGEKILSGMHQKTRYNIRLAQKKKLTLKKGPENAEAFLDLLEETRQRDGFRVHGRKYYQAMIKSNTVELVTVWHDNKILAGSLLAYFGDTVTYVHGASSSEKRDLMAPYFLHWQSILEACSAGYMYYDWHGIDEKKWPGVTRFKLGFGGEIIDYPGTFDMPLAPLAYAGYTVFRRLWRLI
ncbi:MAG TPA: peptidoglycan bridge formation glycyltransferase FemA/FemB family protein [bacterium]|nr:peptidoglycan bridge formation glycyltransferase FemA/FemB family protein [bacterium]